ncbi:hypothetical protein ES707_06715 [subsurface metagenome]
MNFPKIMDTLHLLRVYKTQKSWTDAQLAASMTAFGWDWNESYLTSLFAGRLKLDENKKEYIKLYLLNSYRQESIS